MAINTTTKYKELIAATSPTSYSWAVDGASARVSFIIDASEFYAFVIEVMGGVYFDNTNKLRRFVPLSLPQHPWLYASRITDFKGIGIDGRTSTLNFANFDAFFQLNKTAVPFAGVYQKYKLTIQFETRPYRIIDDANIAAFGVVNENQWFIDTNAAGNVQEVNIPFQDSFEWTRYVTWSEEPKPELLSNNLGSWAYKTIDGVDNTGPINNGAITTQDGSGSNVLLMKSMVSVKWWYVPYEIINNINFFNAYNKVNSQTFLIYPAGTLLLKNIEINPYSSPYPIENLTISPDPQVLMTSYLKNRYCDLTFVFERFDLRPEVIGSLPAADINNLNGKIKAGHNCMPYAGNLLFYYVETQPPANNGLGLPPYWSYNMKQLFLYDPYINP